MRGLLGLLLMLLTASCPLWAQGATEVLRRELKAQGNPEYQDNRVTLLPSAREKYDHMFQRIAQARRYVHLEYFKWMNDSSGRCLMNILGERVKQGVEVRVLIDDFTNRRSKWPWTARDADSLRNIGIRMVFFDRFHFPWVNRVSRDHHKIVVVDGEWAYTGGMNVGDYYLTGTERTGTWRDMHMALEGPVVDEFERIFADVWKRQTGETLDSLRYHAAPRKGGKSVIAVVNRERGRLSKRMREAFVAALDAAQHEVRIVNPYVTNVRIVRKAMRRALKRGVRLRIMVSHKMDVSITPELMAIEMKKLMQRGCEVYYYQGGFHHSKVMTIDGVLCTVGTANLDGRSLLFDYEVNAFVFDPQVTAELDAIFDKDLGESVLLTADNFNTLFNLRQRIVGRVLRPTHTLF